jgi:hypothetical protein
MYIHLGLVGITYTDRPGLSHHDYGAAGGVRSQVWQHTGVLFFDHVIVAVQNLDAAAQLARSKLGWGAIGRGRHPLFGTENVSVPLGGQHYLEFIAAYDRKMPFGEEVARAAEAGPAWFGWALRDDGLERTAERLGLTVEVGSVESVESAEGGGSWLEAGPSGEAESDRGLPFFIDYGSDNAALWAKAYSQAGHDRPPDGIAWVEVGCDSESLRRFLGGAELDVRVVDGARGLRAVGVRLATGGVVELRHW